jgi:hypothetical protein
VCERWRSFAQFAADVGKRPTWRHLLIRDDTSREFSPATAPLAVEAAIRCV